MTCNVSSGTLNSTIPCHTLILVLKLGRHTSTSCKKVSHHWHCLLHMRSTLRKQHFVTKQEMSHKLALMNYLGFVSTPRPHDADSWVEVSPNPCTKQWTHCLKKYFHPLAVRLQWREFLVTVGCSWGQTGHEWATGCCRSWCFCVAITPCNVMFLLTMTVMTV